LDNNRENNLSIHLILGGARSGKSAYAEKLAIESGLPVTYIATAQIYDDEFKARVQHHKDRRPKDWQINEESHFLSDALKYSGLEANIHAASGASKNTRKNKCIIVDCLTLWLAQCICPECAPPEGVNWQTEREKFLAILPKLQGNIILVSNEVGMGIVPLGEINRQFQDEQGRLNQAVAAVADKVTFVAAGLPLKLKG
jgi:adenosylcobinamide kinase / adenosylcobinamide-phosphate guanylyltransferase